jgi:hypothetical protein
MNQSFDGALATTPMLCIAQDGTMDYDSAFQFILNMNAYDNGAGAAIKPWQASCRACLEEDESVTLTVMSKRQRKPSVPGMNLVVKWGSE